MSDIDGMSIDELLSSYIDGELSLRQATEVKRLILHDENIAERLRELERQRALLGALPAAKAPEEMIENIKAVIERKSILGEYSAGVEDGVGAKQLFFRKVLTTAAMIVLPLGVLLWVVFGIIIPVPAGEKPVAGNDVFRPGEAIDKLVADGSAGTTDQASTFVTELELNSYQSIAVSAFIEKLIYEKNLIEYTIPRRKAGESTYQVTCDIAAVVGLLAGLEEVWDKCDSKVFVVRGWSDDQDISIDNVAFGQVMDVFKEDGLVGRTKLAKDFSHFNSMTAGAPGEDVLVDAELDQPVDSEPLTIAKPTLTSGQRQPEVSEPAAEGETVTLTILVKGL